MKLVAKKNGQGYVTSFQIIFGCKEARDYKLLDNEGNVRVIKSAECNSNKTLLIEFEQPIIEIDWIDNTKKLVDEIQKINILNNEELIEITNRIKMQNKNYTEEVKQKIIEKAKCIEFNNLDEEDNIKVKAQLIEDIKNIGLSYFIGIENKEQEEEFE